MTSAHDTIGFWLNAAGRYPLLPKEEVNRLGFIIQKGVAGEKRREKAVEKLVLHNLRLIPGVVRRCVASKRTHKFGDSFTEDLLQCGVIGLRRAAEKFDPSTGYSFSTYAAAWIFQAVHRELYSNLSMMRVPETTIRELYHAIEKNKDYSFRHLKKDQKLRMLDALAALSLTSVEGIIESNDMITDDKFFCVPANGQEQSFSRNEINEYQHMSFDAILNMAALTDNQKKILHHIYVDECNQRQTAELLGVCSTTVKENLKKAQHRLSMALDR